MKVFRYGEDEIERQPDASVTIGTFDGVHMGHRSLLEALLAGQHPTVVTFEPHPQHVLRSRPDRLQILTPTEEKLRKMERLGIERAVILPFNKGIAEIPAEQFLRDILVGTIGLKRLVVGFNHSFGRNREGDIEFMRQRQETYGYELVVVEARTEGDRAVSSTRIRRALSDGDVDSANRYLGMPYRMIGTVVRGDGRGHDLGYPTANLVPLDRDQLVPAEGVYAVRAKVDGKHYDGVASIGYKETFGEGRPLAVEVHLFDVDLDLYGKVMAVDWVSFLRGQKRFDSREELIVQMHEDSRKAREVLGDLSSPK